MEYKKLEILPLDSDLSTLNDILTSSENALEINPKAKFQSSRFEASSVKSLSPVIPKPLLEPLPPPKDLSLPETIPLTKPLPLPPFNRSASPVPTPKPLPFSKTNLNSLPVTTREPVVGTTSPIIIFKSKVTIPITRTVPIKIQPKILPKDSSLSGVLQQSKELPPPVKNSLSFLFPEKSLGKNLLLTSSRPLNIKDVPKINPINQKSETITSLFSEEVGDYTKKIKKETQLSKIGGLGLVRAPEIGKAIPSRQEEISSEEYPSEEDPGYGEIQCQGVYKSRPKAGNQCENKAYWKQDGLYLCGVHAKGKNKVELRKKAGATQRKKEVKKEELEIMIEEGQNAAKQNALEQRVGMLELEKILMFKKGTFKSGFINIYPNFKTAWQGVGLIMEELSPMKLGPVDHGQPGLPPSKNLENFHQGNKFFEGESEEEFRKTRLDFYQDSEPHRHKFTDRKTLFSIWVDKDGSELQLDYIMSRQLYCNFYERLVKTKEEFKELQNYLVQGYNLKICGPDANPIIVDIGESYLDPALPFGHERVLYTMLSFPDSEDEWPWRKNKVLDF